MAIVNGTNRDDRLFGTSGADTVNGFAGNDLLVGRNGNDRLNGGGGNDILNGGFGINTLNGGAGFDRVTYNFFNGGVNVDLRTGVTTSPGNINLRDRLISIEDIVGSSGNDRLIGNNADNDLFGVNGNDILNGFGGEDILSGGNGNDRLFGGEGNDTLNGGFGVDTFNGGAGFDLVNYNFFNGKVNVDLRTGVATFPGNTTLTERLISIEDVIGSGGNNSLIGNNLDNDLFGVKGNDRLIGLDGDDRLNGGEGNDTLNGGFGVDTLNGGAGFDLVTYNFFNGRVNVDLRTGVATFPGNKNLTERLISIEDVIGSGGNNVLIGNSADNDLFGVNGNDILYGVAGDDILYGGNGNDRLIGGGFVFNSFELDTLNGGLGADTFVLGNANRGFYRGEGYATISDFFREDGDKIQLKGNRSNYNFVQAVDGLEIRYAGSVDFAGFVEGVNRNLPVTDPDYISIANDFIYV
ncbi:MAG: calcium-binding protein [Prochloraceae cyanobacterium]|nr:calcium-binding protein [Prochloraceae cyanobacterium]